jgi:hypothetical protein
VLAVASVFVFRRRTGWRRLPALDWMYPVIPVSYIVVGVGMIIWGVLFQPVVSGAAIATIISGALAYRIVTRRRGTN